MPRQSGGDQCETEIFTANGDTTDKPPIAVNIFDGDGHVLAQNACGEKRGGLTAKRLIGFRGVNAVESDADRVTSASDRDGVPVGYACDWGGEDLADLRGCAYRPDQRDQNKNEERMTQCDHTVSLLRGGGGFNGGIYQAEDEGEPSRSQAAYEEGLDFVYGNV